MQITLYSGFSKRPNSTLQPTGGTNVTVTLKERTSIENPTFLLAAGLSSYENITAVKWGSRYYFVSDITSVHNGLTEIACNIDRGATFKTQIGNTNAFIERCASGHSYDLRDDHVLTTNVNFFDSFSGGQLLPTALSSGVIALTLANISPSQATGGTSQIVYFDASGGTYTISQLMNALYDSSVISSIEKILNKPYDAILSVRYIPGFTTANLLAITGKFSSSTILYFGDHAYSGTIKTVKTTGTAPWTYTKTYEFDLASNAHFSIYKWRNMAPYSKWDMFLPFYGTISIPADEYIDTSGQGLTTLVIKACVDLTTGEMVYTRYRKRYVEGVATEYYAQEYRTTIGVEVPIQSSNRDGLAFSADLAVAAGSVALMVASGGITAPLAGAAGGALGKAMVDAYQQTIYTAGSFNAHGTQICTAEPNNVYLMQTGFETQTTPTAYENVIGAPLMENDTISNHAGYIKCMNASVSIPGTQADKDAVNAMLNNGFFFE